MSLMIKQASVSCSEDLFQLGFDSLLVGALTRQVNSFIEQ